MIQKRGQVWVETVIYTLIGLTIMAIIIGVVTPKINQITDQTILSQTKDTLKQLNQEIQGTLVASGNQREVALTIKRGEYLIDSKNNTIVYILKNTGALISQPGESFKDGELTILTEEIAGKKYDVYLTLDYSSFNLTYNNNDINKVLTTAPSAYRLLIVYKAGTPKQIDIQSIGG